MAFLDLERGQRNIRRRLVKWRMKTKLAYIMPRLIDTSSFFVYIAELVSVALLSEKCFSNSSE